MIRQFGFTWTAISWLLMGYGLFFALSPLQAQTAIKKFSLELKNESLPEALKQLEKAGGKNILFTYNGTESYRVTVSIREKTEREAIDLVLAGKPFLCIEREEYFVVQRKKSDKAIATEGKVYDEKGAPLPFVNILALAADSSFLAGSVTEEDGSFHLPPVAGEDCLLKATYIGYRPQIIPCRQQNTIRLQPDTELLKEVVVTASRPLIERKGGTLKANIAGTPLSLMGSAKEIQQATSLTEGDVKAVLESLSHFMGSRLREGERVHLDGIGYFQVKLNSLEPITSPKLKANQMKLKANIGFKADKKLRSSVSVVKVERSKLKLHSVPRSNEEIDRLLTAYFSNNQILTRSDFQGLCKLTLTTAARHIKRLKEEKKLQNINTRQSPVYVPMPGYYGKPEVEDTVK